MRLNRETSALKLLTIAVLLLWFVAMNAQTGDSSSTAKAQNSSAHNDRFSDEIKLNLYYGVLDFYKTTKDTVFLENEIYLFIDRINGSLNFKKGDQTYPVPKSYYHDISKFLFDNFLADDSRGVLKRMSEMSGLLDNAKVGIDISWHQSKIDWDKVKTDTKNAPVEFVIIRSTLGYKANNDTLFESHYTKATESGFPIGLYHNFVMNKDSGNEYPEHVVVQAKRFINGFDKRKVTFKPILDIEPTTEENPVFAVNESQFSTDEIREAAKLFIKTVEEALNTNVIIYTSQCFYNKYLQGYFDKEYVWIARYPGNDNFGQRNVVPGGKIYCGANPFLGLSYDFRKQVFDTTLKSRSIGWQFSDSGKVAGITGYVDLNLILQKDYEKWLWKND